MPPINIIIPWVISFGCYIFIHSGAIWPSDWKDSYEIYAQQGVAIGALCALYNTYYFLNCGSVSGVLASALYVLLVVLIDEPGYKTGLVNDLAASYILYGGFIPGVLWGLKLI